LFIAPMILYMWKPCIWLACVLGYFYMQIYVCVHGNLRCKYSLIVCTCEIYLFLRKGMTCESIVVFLVVSW
jgi:hypothetical protein